MRRPSTGSGDVTPRKLVAVVVLAALVAAACSSDGSSPSPAGEAGPPAPTTAASPDEPTATPEPVELFSPTETDEPYDLDGGAASPDDPEGLIEAGAELDDIVAQATAPWPTDFSRRTVGLDELILGIGVIDPRDRIPPIDTPKFEPIRGATWIGAREPGALVQLDGDVRFYPLSILTRHEIVNDRFGDRPVAVTFCPLCNSALTFDRRVDGEVLRFGVSGLLRNSDLVMYDDATTSLWQQITGEAIVGDFAGTRLEPIATSIVSYADAVENFPDALSLSEETGFGISYGVNGYTGYSSRESPALFDGELDDRFPALSRVVGVSAGGTDKAYPFAVISEELAVNDEVGGVPVAVLWGGDTADALDALVIADAAAIGTGIAFDRRVDGRTLTFTSAGDDLFTDAETGSTWTLLGKAVEGPLSGEQLDLVQHRNEFWFAWAAFFPDAPVHGL